MGGLVVAAAAAAAARGRQGGAAIDVVMAAHQQARSFSSSMQAALTSGLAEAWHCKASATGRAELKTRAGRWGGRRGAGQGREVSKFDRYQPCKLHSQWALPLRRTGRSLRQRTRFPAGGC